MISPAQFLPLIENTHAELESRDLAKPGERGQVVDQRVFVSAVLVLNAPALHPTWGVAGHAVFPCSEPQIDQVQSVMPRDVHQTAEAA